MKQILLLLLLGFLTVPNLAQDEFVYNNCPYSAGEYYIPDVVIRYEAAVRRLVMVSNLDGSITRVIEENVDMLHFGVFSWSPNCRYMIGLLEDAMDRYGKSLAAALWDINTGLRLQSITTSEMNIPRSYGLQVLWKPDGSQAMIDTDVFGTNRFILWRGADNSLLPLIVNDYFSEPDLLNAYWDESRNQLYLSAYSCVGVYDLTTGAKKACYSAIPEDSRYIATTFYISPDATRIVVFTNAAPRQSEGYPAYLTIWSLDTDGFVEVNLGGYSANAQQVALSQDNRYLVLANRSLLRVWDIQNLPENFEERKAIYTHAGPEGLISRIYFVDAETIETISEDGIQRWNIHTGAYIPAN